MSKVSGIGLNKKNPKDLFYTPNKLAQDLIGLVPIRPNDSLLDPFLGEGAFFDNYPTNCDKDWCEIEKGKDFFEYSNKVDWIISNPPFSKFNPIIDKCASLVNKGFALVAMSVMLSVPRIKKIEDLGFVITGFHWFTVNDWFRFPCVFIICERKGIPFFKLPIRNYKHEAYELVKHADYL